MNRYKLLFFLLLVSVFPEHLHASHRLATFNIRCIQKVDTAGRDWSERGPQCARLIKDYRFDVVGLQELTGDGVAYRNPNTGRSQLDDMRTWLPDYELLVWDRDGAKRKEYVGIAFRKSRYIAVDEGFFFISATPDKYSLGWDPKVRKHPRVVGWVRLRDKKSKDEFIFASTHTNNGWSLDGPYGSELVANKIREIAGGTPVMVVGDFNTTRDEIDRKGLKAYLAAFHDAALEVDAKKNYSLPKSNSSVTWTYNGFKIASDTTSQGREIDYMFYDGMKIKERHIITQDFKYKDRKCTLSDHFPVCVDAEITSVVPRTIYVNCGIKDGDGSALKPFASISQAIKIASLNDTIKVVAGEYRESVVPKNSLSIIGGYDTSFSSVDGKSVIDGRGLSRSPIYAAGNVSLYLKNFEIRDYTSTQMEYDGAIHFNGANLELENVAVRDCKAKRFGGGLSIYNICNPGYCECNNLIIKDCIFEGNEAEYGGGISVGVYGRLEIERSMFKNNKASQKGGGVYLTFGKPEKDKIRFTKAKVRLCKIEFIHNTAEDDAAIYINSQMPGVNISMKDIFVVN